MLLNTCKPIRQLPKATFRTPSHGGQVGMLLNTCKPIESTNNFYMWRAIFDKLICEDTLERPEKASASGERSHGHLGEFLHEIS